MRFTDCWCQGLASKKASTLVLILFGM